MNKTFSWVVLCLFLAAAAYLIVRPSDNTGQVDAAQFDRTKTLCEKNGGMMSAQYGNSSDLLNPHYRPAFAHCKDGARFEVPKDIQLLNRKD